MEDDGKKNRRSKRELANVDVADSASEQPAVKVARRDEESVPSTDVLELQLKVAKLELAKAQLEEKLQRANEATRQAEERAVLAENQLNSLREIKDGAAKKEEKEKEEEKEKKPTAQVQKGSEDVHQLTKGVAAQLQLTQKQHSSDADFPPGKMAKVADVRKEERLRQPQMQLAAAATQLPSPFPVVKWKAPKTRELFGTPKCPGLFELCYIRARSINADNAVELVRHALELHGREHIKKSRVETLHCKMCKWSYVGVAVVDHFISPAHRERMRDMGTRVNYEALEHWLELLQPTDGQ